MFELRKAILITNNDRVYDKYKNKLACIYTKDYEDTLIKVRDYVYNRHQLLTHPQALSPTRRPIVRCLYILRMRIIPRTYCS